MARASETKRREEAEFSRSHQELEATIGHSFANEDLIRCALTHPSYTNEVPGETDFERLEFLGDAVLNMLVAVDLFLGFPELDQGALTRARASLVNEGCLADVARALNLGRFLRLAKGENALGGRDKASILSDALEAVLGAVFLDGGHEAAAGLVRRILGPLYAKAAAGELSGDVKTTVNDLVWRRFHAAASYVHTGRTGPPHAPTFEVELRLGERVLGHGRGGSKKEAEQEAARSAVRELAETGSTKDDEPRP